MNKNVKLTLSAMFLALGVLLPQVTHLLPEFAKQLSLMHIPTYIGGMICGPLYGVIIGVFSPLLSMLLFSMPNGLSLYSMMIELGVYGFMSGLLYRSINTKNNIVNIYLSLIGSMITGKIVYGICNVLIFKAGQYSFSLWITAAFISGFIGIIVHLVIIPPIIMLFQKKVNYNK